MGSAKFKAFLFFSLVFIQSSHLLAKTPEFIPGEYLVQFKGSVQKETLLRQFEGTLPFQIKRWIPKFNLAVVRFDKNLAPQRIISSFLSKNWVHRIEPNYIYRIQRTPNDPQLQQLWGLINVGQPDSKDKMGIKGMDIGAEAAWDLQTGNQDLVIAVIDTGVNYRHPDLSGNIWTNEAEEKGQPGVDDDGNGFIDDIHGYDFANKDGDPMDDHGHGTHCSGTIGARGDDGQGIVGVTWQSKIMAIKFLSKSGSGNLEDAVLGIKYATAMGAKIMSNSWGGGAYSEILKEAIEEAGQKGVLFTAAAGNSSNNNDASASYPANYNLPNVVSVAAVDNQGNLASFSNFGKRTVHVAAPGVNIQSSIIDGYDSWSGTSMATPHVTGVAALLLSSEPELSPLAIRQRLVSTSKPIAALKGKVASNGLVNAYLALTNQAAPPDLNDPENWTQFREEQISTEHPYAKNVKQSWEIEIPGVSQLAVYFTQFNIENKYDKVSFYNRKGELLAVMTGDLGPTWSPALQSDYIKIEFTTDKSVNKYGFDLTRVAYK